MLASVSALVPVGFLAESSAVKDNGTPAVWFGITGFALFLALVLAVFAYLARRDGKDDRYTTYKRAIGGLLTMALLSFIRAMALR